MAEVLAVVGGLAAAVQLCGSALRFSNVLFRFSTDAGAATAEVERFALQVRSFSKAVNVAQITLIKYIRECPKSAVVVHISSVHILADIDSEAATVQKHLLDIQAQVKGLKSRSVVWASIKWTWNKSSIMELLTTRNGERQSKLRPFDDYRLA